MHTGRRGQTPNPWPVCVVRPRGFPQPCFMRHLAPGPGNLSCPWQWHLPRFSPHNRARDPQKESFWGGEGKTKHLSKSVQQREANRESEPHTLSTE